MRTYPWNRTVWLLFGAVVAVGCSSFGDLLNPSFEANLGINPSSPNQTDTLVSATTFAFVNASQVEVAFNVVYQTTLNSSNPQGQFTLSRFPATPTSPQLQFLQTPFLLPGEARTVVIECPSVLNLGEDADPVTDTGGTGLPTGNVLYYGSSTGITGMPYSAYGGPNLLQTRDFQCGQVLVYTATGGTPTTQPTIVVSVRNDIPSEAEFYPPPQ